MKTTLLRRNNNVPYHKFEKCERASAFFIQTGGSPAIWFKKKRPPFQTASRGSKVLAYQNRNLNPNRTARGDWNN